MRYITNRVKSDLQKKLVFLAGPRQVGKSTVANSFIASPSNYLNWDISKDRLTIREMAWPKDSGLVVLDELHKYVKWKSFLKGVIDEFHNKPPLLVTGSARLETFRKGGDALTGRTYMYHLHPIDPLEAVREFGAKDYLSATKVLLNAGGFPEAFLNPDDADRLREDRLRVVLREDVRDLSMISDLRGMELLIELLRERVGGPVNYSNLASDIGISPPTVKKWIELLERLYVIFQVYPYSRNLARSIRREPKVYFYDCSAAANGEGFRFENLVGAALLKWMDFFNDSLGRRYTLRYFRDKDGREVDFVVCDGLRPKVLVEAKLSDVSLHPALSYLGKRLSLADCFQVVGGAVKQQQVGDVRIIGIDKLEDLIEKIGSLASYLKRS